MQIKYDPPSSPLDLPLSWTRYRCQANVPFMFPQRAGATPGTVLAGAFKRAATTLAEKRAAECELLRWLVAPETAGATLRPAAALTVPEFDRVDTVREFTLEARLLGRRAVAAKELIGEIIDIMGRHGLAVAGAGLIEFSVAHAHAAAPTSLRALAQRYSCDDVRSAWRLEWHTPLAQSPGADAELSRLIANSAYHLARFDLAEVDAPAADAHALALEAKQHALAVSQSIQILQHESSGYDGGTRKSGSNQGHFKLEGSVSAFELRVPRAALPWLVNLAYGAMGPRSGLGFSRARLWLDPIPR